MLRLPRTEGFEAVQLFFGILHELACADRTQVELIGVQSSDSTLPHSRRINKIVQFVEKNYHHKISLEDVGELVGMSASSVSRFSNNAPATISGTISTGSASTAPHK